MEQIILNFRNELKNNTDEKTQNSTQRFFKEKILTYGVKSQIMKKLIGDYYKIIENESKNRIFEICTQLWQSGYFEEELTACNWAYNLHKQFEPKDFSIFENWVSNYVDNWASCDTLCNHTIGTFIDMFPQYIENLKIWAKSNNRWMKRASAVTLIIPARNGRYLNHIFQIADILLLDKDDMVQKGYGWMLKAASETHQKEVFDYVVKNKTTMPRTALRYAIEKMPKEMKAIAMKK